MIGVQLADDLATALGLPCGYQVEDDFEDGASTLWLLPLAISNKPKLGVRVAVAIQAYKGLDTVNLVTIDEGTVAFELTMEAAVALARRLIRDRLLNGDKWSMWDSAALCWHACKPNSYEPIKKAVHRDVPMVFASGPSAGLFRGGRR